MKRALAGSVTLALALYALSSTDFRIANGQVAFDQMSASGQDVRMNRVAEGVYQFTTMRDSYVRQLNSVAIVTRDGVIVFDTNTRPSSARIVLERIRAITAKPVVLVINSHGHPDHWSGNQVFAEAFPGIGIIATDSVAADMHAKAGIWIERFETELAARTDALEKITTTGRRTDGSTVTPAQLDQARSDLTDYRSLTAETRTLRRVFPTMTYSGQKPIRIGGLEFRLIEVTGDQPGTTVLYLPKQRVVLTGDAVSYPIPYVSARPSQQIGALRRIAALEPLVIVPGHGPAFRDQAFLQLELQLLETVVAEVENARAIGVRSVDGIRKMRFAESLRARFVHGDPDLDARFTARVADLAVFAFEEQEAPR